MRRRGGKSRMCLRNPFLGNGFRRDSYATESAKQWLCKRYLLLVKGRGIMRGTVGEIQNHWLSGLRL
jgi:hypothetical protein